MRAELGLWRRFRRHISDAFEAKREHLLRDAADSESFCYVQEEAARYAVAEDCDEYLAENIFWDEGSFQRDALPDLRADFVLAKPPFNISDWGGERLREDARWQYAVPPAGNANYAWLQHIVHHLRPTGTAGVVLANGSMSSQQSGEGDIRRAMVEGDVVDCMVALPPQLSYSTQIPVCLWFLARDKRPAWKGGAKGARDRRGEVLFIDARELSDEYIARIAGAYHAWRNETSSDVGRVSPPGRNPTEASESANANVGLRFADPTYEDEPGFCKAASLNDIRGHDHVLSPGRYVGAAAVEDDGTPLPGRFAELKAKLDEQLAKGEALGALIQAKLGGGGSLWVRACRLAKL